MDTNIEENNSAPGDSPVMDIMTEKAANTDEEFFEDAVQTPEHEATESTDDSAEPRFSGQPNRGGFRYEITFPIRHHFGGN